MISRILVCVTFDECPTREEAKAKFEQEGMAYIRMPVLGGAVAHVVVERRAPGPPRNLEAVMAPGLEALKEYVPDNISLKTVYVQTTGPLRYSIEVEVT